MNSKKSIKIKNSYKFYKETVEEKGWIMISENYKNARTRMKVKCNKGHITEKYPMELKRIWL
jgi:hypothetical protein